MNLDLLSRELDIFYRSLPTNIFTEIPAGTGICHIANVAPYCWKSGFVSRYEGRWKLPGEYKKHFGDYLRALGGAERLLRARYFQISARASGRILRGLWAGTKEMGEAKFGDYEVLRISVFSGYIFSLRSECFGIAARRWWYGFAYKSATSAGFPGPDWHLRTAWDMRD